MAALDLRQQRGQAIVLIALVIVVMIGFLGLALDGGRGYLDRRQLQASVDAAALAAAYNYMNTTDYSQAEHAATNQYANNERLYMTPVCSGYGTLSVSCTFGDSTNQVLALNVVNHSIAGVTFTATGSHQIPVAVMQVLGSSSMAIGATATAVARKAGTYGAAIQTLSPGGCPAGSGVKSLTFQGTSTTTVTGDVWSNGVIFDNSNANGGSITGNVIGICPAAPFLTTPTPWTVSGSQSTGFNIPDPNYPAPPINPTSRTWNSTSGSVEQAGTYAADPSISGGKPCFFLAPGVYDFAAGFTDNAGFISNELRPPDEPEMATAGQPNTTTLNGSLSGTNITSIAVNALPSGIPAGSSITVGGQTFTLSSNAAGGGMTIYVNKQSVAGTIPSGSMLSVRALPQFWDSNGVNCSGTFTATNPGSSTNNLTGVWSVVLTAVRWEPTSGSTCSGVATPTCYVRESPPSMCKTVDLGSSGNIKVAASSANSATADPGAHSFNVYLASNGSCTGLAYATNFSNGSNASTVINSSTFPAGWPTGQPGPPDGEGMPIASGLPNADTSAGAPPHGDLANERQCINPATGNDVACASPWTPGAVVFYIPSTGCLDTHGGHADMYVFSGYQYSRVLLYEPGPEQSSSPNSCSNYLNGNGFTSLIGIVYVPAASITINGNTTYQATIAGGVIAWTAAITGSGGVAIIADPTLRTWPSTVRLTQ